MSSCFSCDPCQEVGIIRKLRGVLEGKSGGARSVFRDDQRRDFDDLALTSSGRTGVLLRVGDVLLRRGTVTAVRGQKRDQGMLDRVHRGDHAVPREQSGDGETVSVIVAAWAGVLTGR